MQNLAASAYQKTSQSTVNPRELEAQLLMKAAAMIQKTLDSWDQENPDAGSLRDALTYNRRLWTILSTSVTSEDNPLPKDVKENVGALGAFILRLTVELMIEPKPERARTLVSINRNIAQGLRGA
ncbi:flagellar biosynthesis regulator FlaF [Rhizobiales bacterium]|uniref:flagellar biosynthesis regulator FlaF n=1 Tax=Hongsoonwoonella zoysiae TaxID=2821844 RepID=UPI001561113D|nr:flagellar biosynthesis regulator FlaF [Hongsoonwoonella zoysiae]NRG18003.1 flagellar biosynthesis regulator FlaF [Hongsoonwoonella zoysiae]